MENGEWIMRGPAWEDPACIHSWQELVDWIDEVGFLPLFRNGIDGFSAEERTCPTDWWSGDAARDPWEWRQLIACSGRVVYGKFFGKKASFISKAWFPDFANWRRDGYDFDSRWDDGLATARQKKIMDQFTEADALLSYELKERAGFGKGGEKNFEGTVTDLQMSSYLVIRDFRQKLNKKSSLTAGHRQSIRRRKCSGVRSASPQPTPLTRYSPGRRCFTRFRPIFPPPLKR